MAREYGLFVLSKEAKSAYPDYETAVLNFLLTTDDYEQVLDVVELSFKLLGSDYCANWQYRENANPAISSGDAISELNQRFMENGIGYQFEAGEILRIDSQVIHSEVVKPVLVLLQHKQFKGANEEFLKAHEHYRKGDYKECFNECLKAFESTMKSICIMRKWAYLKNDTARRLIEICFDNKLLPDFLQQQFSSLRSNLESGIPTMRNRLGGHGQGPQIVDPPQYFASYLLHLTATTILLLVNADRNLK